MSPPAEFVVNLQRKALDRGLTTLGMVPSYRDAKVVVKVFTDTFSERHGRQTFEQLLA